MGEHLSLLTGFPVPRIIGRGRPKGSGCNVQILNLLKPGDTSSCIWGLSKAKMRSVKTTASYHKMKIKVRMLEKNGLYAIWRM